MIYTFLFTCNLQHILLDILCIGSRYLDTRPFMKRKLTFPQAFRIFPVSVDTIKADNSGYFDLYKLVTLHRINGV